MAINKWLVFILALAFWAVFFYLVDGKIMETQGLPVNEYLMPA